jgi:hypothetical protein
MRTPSEIKNSPKLAALKIHLTSLEKPSDFNLLYEPEKYKRKLVSENLSIDPNQNSQID